MRLSRSLITIMLCGVGPLSRAAIAQQQTLQVQQVGAGPTETRLFPLQFLSNQDAATLIAPFVQVDGRYGVFEAGPAVRGITVRASKEIVVRVDSLLRAHDRAPTSIVLRFQLIAALDSTVRDPSIPGNVDATLRDLFRFGGYRLLAQGTATVGSATFEVTMGAGNERYTISGSLADARGSGGRGRGTAAPAPMSAPSPSSVDLSVNLRGPVENIMANGIKAGFQYQTLLSTGLSVPIGETVVLGSAAATSEGRRALILTVRPDALVPAGRGR